MPDIKSKYGETITCYPLTNVGAVAEFYAKKDGVDVTYVCTTALNSGCVEYDVFYRETPHPEFGNKYFGITEGIEPGSYMITDADIVESFTFSMVMKDGKFLYSQNRHDCVWGDKGNMVDGGRAYTRSSGKVSEFNIINGLFVRKT